MANTELSKTLRKICELIFTHWASLVFQGVAFGAFILFLANLFEPYIIREFGGLINIKIPEWMFFAAGIGITVSFNIVKGKPILKDSNREQFEAVDYVIQKLPEIDRVQIYRKIACKIVDKFEIDKVFKIDLKTEAEEAIAEETGNL